MVVEVDCPACGRHFETPHSLKGGLTNCPSCRKAVPVAGGPELLFWILLSGGILMVLLASAIAFFLGGPLAGGIVFLIGGALLGGIVAAS